MINPKQDQELRFFYYNYYLSMYHLVSKYTCVKNEGKGITIYTEGSSQSIDSEVATDVLLQIARQSASEDQLLENCQSFMEQLERRHVLSELEREGVIFQEQEEIDADFWACLGYQPERLASILKHKKVNILSLEQVDHSAFLEKAFSDAGLQTSDTPELTICLVDDYSNPKLEQLNQDFLANKQKWMLVNVSSFRPTIGPIFVPDESACISCLQQRMKMNNTINRFSRTHYSVNTQKRATSSISINMAMSKVVLALVDTLYHDFKRKY